MSDMFNEILLKANKRHNGKIQVMHFDENKFFMILFLIFAVLHYGIGCIVFVATWMMSSITNKIPVKPIWYYKHFISTIGRRIFVPNKETFRERPFILRHEIAHMDQQYFGHPDLHGEWKGETLQEVSWKDKALYAIKYALLPSYRWQTEQWGYLQEIRYQCLDNPSTKWSESQIDYFSSFLSGPSYLWMTSKEEATKWIHYAFITSHSDYEHHVLRELFLGPKVADKA